MSAAEPSVSLQCCTKVADVPPLRLMNGACLCIANLFYLLRQTNPSRSTYNPPDPRQEPQPHIYSCLMPDKKLFVQYIACECDARLKNCSSPIRLRFPPPHFFFFDRLLFDWFDCLFNLDRDNTDILSCLKTDLLLLLAIMIYTLSQSGGGGVYDI